MPTTQCQQLIHNRWLVFREEEAGTDGQEVPARPQAAAPNAVHDLEVQLLCVVPCEDEEPAGLQEAADSTSILYSVVLFKHSTTVSSGIRNVL